LIFQEFQQISEVWPLIFRSFWLGKVQWPYLLRARDTCCLFPAEFPAQRSPSFQSFQKDASFAHNRYFARECASHFRLRVDYSYGILCRRRD
jgi:hypothetical protein